MERKRRVYATDHHKSAIIPFITFSLKPLMTLTGRARKNKRNHGRRGLDSVLLFFRSLDGHHTTAIGHCKEGVSSVESC